MHAPSATEGTAMRKVIVFGSMNMDLSISAPRMPEAGETISGSGFLTNAGGKGANQAVASSRLGASTHMVAAVGADAFGDELTAGLAAAGVDVSNVRRLEGVSTGVAVIVRTEGENRIVLSAGANHALGLDDVVSDLRRIASPGDVFLAQGECDPAATEAAIRAARELGLYTVYNPAPARPAPDDLWPCVDLVCLNETECQIMCGVLPADDETCLAAARLLRTRDAGAVVITLGSAGSFGLGADGEALRIPAAQAPAVVDTTGAGDTFAAALLTGLVEGKSIYDAGIFANAAGAFAVTKKGPMEGAPKRAWIDAFLASGKRELKLDEWDFDHMG